MRSAGAATESPGLWMCEGLKCWNPSQPDRVLTPEEAERVGIRVLAVEALLPDRLASISLAVGKTGSLTLSFGEGDTLRGLSVVGASSCTQATLMFTAQGDVASALTPNADIALSPELNLEREDQALHLVASVRPPAPACESVAANALAPPSVSGFLPRCREAVAEELLRPTAHAFPLTDVCVRHGPATASLDGLELDALGRPTEVWVEHVARTAIRPVAAFESQASFLLRRGMDRSSLAFERIELGPRERVIHLRWYGDSDQLAELWSEIDGLRHGPAIVFDPRGNLLAAGGYASGEPNGIWILPISVMPGAPVILEDWSFGELVRSFGPHSVGDWLP